MTFVNNNFSKLHYKLLHCENPNAEYIVFAHGLGMDMSVWDLILPYFKNDYHILLFDFRGHGLSPKWDNEHSWERMIEDYEALIEEVNIKEYHYVAHGLGAHFGVEFFADNDRSLKSFCILSTPFYYPGNVGEKALEIRKNIAELNSFQTYTESLTRQIIYPFSEEKSRILMNSYAKTDKDTYVNLIWLIFKTLSLEKLKLIRSPILLLTGEVDIIYPPKLIMLSTSYFNNCTYYIVPDAANMVELDQPSMIAEWTKNFITKENNYNAKPSYTIELDEHLNTIISQVSNRLIGTNKKPMVKLDIINQFHVEINNNTVEGQWNSRKAKELFAFILLNGYVLRETLYETFWSHSPLPKAQNQLRVSLNHLRKLIGVNLFETLFKIDKQSIAFKGEVECDLVDLLNQIKLIKEEKSLEIKNIKNNELISQFPSNILPGFFDDWFTTLITEIEDNIIQIQEELLRFNTKINNYTDAKENEKLLNQLKYEEVE